MTDDLVKRLRSKTPNMVVGHEAMEEAADRIEALTDARDDLTDARDIMRERWEQEQARAEAAERREAALLASNNQERLAMVENASLRERLKDADAEVARLRMILAARDAIDAAEPSQPPVTSIEKREIREMREGGE